MAMCWQAAEGEDDLRLNIHSEIISEPLGQINDLD